jgi:hypothetical protein
MLFPNGMKVCLAGCAWRARGKRVRAHRMQSDSAPTAPARGCIFGPSGVAELSSDDDSLRRCACERGFCFGKVFLTNRKRIQLKFYCIDTMLFWKTPDVEEEPLKSLSVG